MKNPKTLSGVAYMFLGAALLVSGASLQEQMDRLAADPELQLAKAMYVSMFNRGVAAKTEFLASNIAATPLRDEYGVAPEVAPLVAKRVRVAVAPREVVNVLAAEFPNVEVEISELPKRLAPVRPSRMKMQLMRVHARMAALQSMPDHFKFTYFTPATPVPPTPGFDFDAKRMVAEEHSDKCEESVTASETEMELE